MKFPGGALASIRLPCSCWAVLIYAWLVGYSAILGPIAGIVLTDYFLFCGTVLDVNALCSEEPPTSILLHWRIQCCGLGCPGPLRDAFSSWLSSQSSNPWGHSRGFHYHILQFVVLWIVFCVVLVLDSLFWMEQKKAMQR